MLPSGCVDIAAHLPASLNLRCSAFPNCYATHTRSLNSAVLPWTYCKYIVADSDACLARAVMLHKHNLLFDAMLIMSWASTIPLHNTSCDTAVGIIAQMRLSIFAMILRCSLCELTSSCHFTRGAAANLGAFISLSHRRI